MVLHKLLSITGVMEATVSSTVRVNCDSDQCCLGTVGRKETTVSFSKEIRAGTLHLADVCISKEAFMKPEFLWMEEHKRTNVRKGGC